MGHPSQLLDDRIPAKTRGITVRVFLPLFVTGLTGFLAGCPAGKNPTKAPPPTPASAGTSSLRLLDQTSQSGLAHRWLSPGKPPLNILQTIGNGAAVLDVDGDNAPDILLVDRKPRLFRGNGKGGFRDATAASGLSTIAGHFLGVAVGDIDNDGDPDVYLSGYRTACLLRNDNGVLRDITKASGLRNEPWGTSAAFADTDKDGNLDLYVGNYAIFGPETKPQLCLAHGMETSCGPREYQPEKGRLYLGNGKGGFRDVTKPLGIDDISGKTLGVAIADIDSSGKPAIALANDEMPGDLLVPATNRWENIGSVAGVSHDAAGNLHGGMGTDWGDVDGDGRLDLFVATFQNEVKSLYRNEGERLFTEVSASMGLGAARPWVAFGCKFVDLDNDGHLDLVIANGHVQDNIEKIDRSTTFRQPTQVFRNTGAAAFEDRSSALQGEAARPIVGRGLATGDFDNDGLVDVVVVDSFGEPLLLRNQSTATGNWIGLKLDQGTRGPRDATGATVVVKAGGRSIVRHVHSDGSYLSASDTRVVVGLGAAKAIESVEITWTDGTKETVQGLAPGRYWIVERGKAPR